MKSVGRVEVLLHRMKNIVIEHALGKPQLGLQPYRYMENRNTIHQSIKEYIIEWSIDNKETVTKTPLNKIKTTIAPLLNEIQELFGIRTLE